MGGVVVGWLMWKRRHQERALVLWDDLNRRLASAGLPRHSYEGPLDFAKRAATRWPQFAIAFSAIGESFAELRYGAIDVGRERDALVATLERAIEVLPAPATLALDDRLEERVLGEPAALELPAELVERLALDLAHALARDAELGGEIFERGDLARS